MDRVHEGNYHPMQERGMKKPESWTCRDHECEYAPSESFLEAESTAGRGSLEHDSQALKNEVSRGQTVAPARRKRDHEVVNQSGSDEHQQTRGSRTERLVKRSKDEIMSELAEAQVPALAPEFTEARGEDGLRHDWGSVHAHPLPEQRDQVEAAEVQEKDQAEEADPSLE